MNQLTISLSAIKKNYRILKNRLGSVECGAVVKANAYGLGYKQVSEALYAEGCRKFFVALLEEAVQLRAVLPDAEIFVFHGINDESEQNYFEHYNITPVLNNPDQHALWKKEIPAAVHFDTGMTRLGFAKSQAGLLMQNKIKLVMSHLSCAEQPKNPYNYNQLLEFEEITKILPNFQRSFCNSAGIFLGAEFHMQLARPGIALYGGNPTPLQDNPMLGVVKITSRIIQTHFLKDKRAVGYGATYQAKAGDVIGIVPCGYADGILRSLSNSGKVYVKEHALPIIGRVSMDLIAIKLNNLPPELQKTGTEVEIIGENNTVCAIAKDAGTIEYEILTRLGNRFKRTYEE